ncbi:hypothetical protein ACCI51_17825 [Microbulbifer echini]|uniref:Uncharacterized protein n=1 Tax=Microbulbifer echini TaxID=1529067 RepID=A0ABV4NTZ8_9GAMM|nr:hypothetical protein [uncultured Microbulbifer sp.]
MKMPSNKLSMILLATVFSFSITACEDKPAETLGERVDEKAEQLGNTIEDACEEVKEGVDAKDSDC